MGFGRTRVWALVALGCGCGAAVAAAQPAPGPAGDPSSTGGGAAEDAADDHPVRAARPAVVWRYRTPDGRDAFVPSLAAIPPGAQGVEPVDLADTPLNVALGNELRDAVADPAVVPDGAAEPDDRILGAPDVEQALALERERAELVRSEACERAREGKAEPFSRRVLREHVHLPILALVALLLVGLGPSMARRYAAPQWMRFVAFALPMLGFLAMTTSTVIEASRLQRAVRESSRVCDPGLRFGPLDSARALEQRLEVVDTLRAYVGQRGL